jgi:hypothetical protein
MTPCGLCLGTKADADGKMQTMGHLDTPDQIKAVQRVWNRNHPNATVLEDGVLNPKTVEHLASMGYVIVYCTRRASHTGKCRTGEPILLDQFIDLYIRESAERPTAKYLAQLESQHVGSPEQTRAVAAVVTSAIMQRWYEDHERHHDLQIVLTTALMQLSGNHIIEQEWPGVAHRPVNHVEEWVEIACDTLRSGDKKRIPTVLRIIYDNADPAIDALTQLVDGAPYVEQPTLTERLVRDIVNVVGEDVHERRVAIAEAYINMFRRGVA